MAFWGNFGFKVQDLREFNPFYLAQIVQFDGGNSCFSFKGFYSDFRNCYFHFATNSFICKYNKKLQILRVSKAFSNHTAIQLFPSTCKAFYNSRSQNILVLFFAIRHGRNQQGTMTYIKHLECYLQPNVLKYRFS
jgi:hypothetical protein